MLKINKKDSSPFVYDRIARKNEFFGRRHELDKLDSIVKNSNNLLLHSKRRMGKSSLIHYFLSSKKEDYLCIFVDIFDITSKEEFAISLLKALTNANKGDIKTVLKNLQGLFKRVRLEPTIDANTLKYSIKPVVISLTFEQMIEDFFQTLEALAKHQKIILAIDEFQQIAMIKEVKLDAILRKYIQIRGNISYIFSGSKRHLLTALFNYQAPLYELAEHLELPALEKSSIYQYTGQFLALNQDHIDCIYEKADGETKIIQHILHLLYISKNRMINTALIDDKISHIISSKDSSYRMVFDSLNNNQKQALKIVGKYKSGFFASEILIAYRIKKQTLQSAINTLFKRELIDKINTQYFIPDRGFELWIEWYFD